MTTRRGVLVAALGGMCWSAGSGPGGAPSLFRSAAAAMDPVTAVQLASAALAVIQSFSSGGDGGLAATLRAQMHMLQLISQQLDKVNTQLTAIQAALKQLPDELAEQISLGRLQGYYDQVVSSTATLQEKAFTYANPNTSKAERKALTGDFKKVADDLQNARNLMIPYPSLIPALALPVALGAEVAARRLAGEPGQIAAALDKYEAGISAMLNNGRSDSVITSLNKYVSKHATEMAECKALTGESCLIPPGQSIQADVLPCRGHMRYGGDGWYRTDLQMRFYAQLSANERDGWIALERSSSLQEKIVNSNNSSQCKWWFLFNNGTWVDDSFALGRPHAAMPPDERDFYAQKTQALLSPGVLPKENDAKLTAAVQDWNSTRMSIALYSRTLTMLRETQHRIHELRGTL